MSIRYEHIALEDVQNLNLRSFNQVYIIDLNKSYLTTQDQQIDDRLTREDLVEFLPIGQSKNQQMLSRFDIIVNLILHQQLKQNPILKQLQIFGMKGKNLIQLFSSQDFQKDASTFKSIKQLIVDNITSEKGDSGQAILQYLQQLQGIMRSGITDRSIGSCLEVFFFMNGSEISTEIETKCGEELAKLKLATDKVSISYRISDFFTNQNTLKKLIGLTQKDMYSEDIGQLQYLSWLETSYINQMLDIIQNKRINKYEYTARYLKQYHEESPVQLEPLYKHFKVCQETSSELPIDDNKSKERSVIVERNINILKDINDQLNTMSITHPKSSMQQILYRKKMILRLIHYGISLEDEKNFYQHKAQNVIFERHELAKQLSEYLFDLKLIFDSKLEIFSGELLLNDVNVNTCFLFDYLKQDLQFTKKMFEISQEINAKIFILKKNVEKCNQKDLAEQIDQSLKQIQQVQFRTLRNIENSIIRVFICLQQILECMGLKNVKINSKKKAVFDELTNLLRANSEYQSYLPSNCEGTTLGRSFKIIIETYFKEFLK